MKVKVLNDKELAFMEQFFQMTQKELLMAMKGYLEQRYDNVIATKDYVVAIGDIPIALVAHLDTVFKYPPEEIYYDRVKNVMWSPAGLGADDGIVVIMGTGSSCFRRISGEVNRFGGYGYLFDHAGGGYDLGNAAISLSCKAEDGSGRDTLLRELIKRELNTATVAENISHFYSIGKSGIASFAPLVFEAYEKGDEIAGEILRDSMRHVAGLIVTAGRGFADGNERIKVVCVGGLTKKADILFPMLDKELELLGYKDKFAVSVFDGDVVVGALMQAGAVIDK